MAPAADYMAARASDIVSAPPRPAAKAASIDCRQPSTSVATVRGPEPTRMLPSNVAASARAVSSAAHDSVPGTSTRGARAAGPIQTLADDSSARTRANTRLARTGPLSGVTLRL